MKTSTKLLIGLFIVIIMIDLYVLIRVRLAFEGTHKDNKLPDFEYFEDITKSEKKLNDYNQLVADGFIRINYFTSDESKMVVNASKKSADKLHYNIVNNSLHINIDNINPKKELIEINIYTDSLNSITLMDGVRFETDDMSIHACKIILKNAVFNGTIYSKYLQIEQNDKSRATIEGKTEKMLLLSKEYSVVNALELAVNHAEIEASGMSKAEVNVHGSMKINLKENSTLRYTGNPVIENIIINSGAQIIEIKNGQFE